MIRHAQRIVATFPDATALQRARAELRSLGVAGDAIEVQRGDDRVGASRRDDVAPRPTRPAELRVRAPRSLAATLLAGALGGGIGVLVFRGVDVPGLPRWADLVVFAAIGLLPATAYAFVMSGGGGPHPIRETATQNEGLPLTMSVRVDPQDAALPDSDQLRRCLLGAGAIHVEARTDRTEAP